MLKENQRIESEKKPQLFVWFILLHFSPSFEPRKKKQGMITKKFIERSNRKNKIKKKYQTNEK